MDCTLARSARLLVLFAPLSIAALSSAQSVAPKSLVLSGVYSVDSGLETTTASFSAVALDSSKNIYALLDEGDGVRVLKLNPAGTQRLASAHFGAQGDHGYGLALDSSGNVYVVGQTTSGTLSSSGALAFDGTPQGFLAVFPNSLASSTITSIGGSNSSAVGVAFSSAGFVAVTGTVQSSNLPVTPDAPIPFFPGNSSTTGFLEAFTNSGATLAYATYLGGANGNTFPAAIAVDSAGNAYVTGSDTATGFPTVNAFQPELVGTSDLFLTKLSESAGLEFSTQLGSAGGTVAGAAVALAPNGSILVGANATALGIPVTSELEPLPLATNYAVVLSFASSGEAINYSTVMGDGTISGIASDANGNAWLTGTINDLAGWPLINDTQHIGTGFVSALSTTGSLLYSTRLGGIAAYSSTTQQSRTTLNSVAVASDGTVLTAGGWSLLTNTSNLDPENLDLSYVSAPSAALPGTLTAAITPQVCTTSTNVLCGAGYVAELGGSSTTASLGLSVDTLPNLTLRNLGHASVTPSGVSAGNYTVQTDCLGKALVPGAACNIALAGNGPGTLSITTAASGTYAWSLTGPALAAAQNAVQVQPKEVVASAANNTDVQEFSVVFSNVTSAAQVAEITPSKASAFDIYDDTASTACVDAGYPYYAINANSSCTVLAQYENNARYAQLDGPQQGYVDVQISGQPVNSLEVYGYALAELSDDVNGGLVLSSANVGFGTQYIGQPIQARGVAVTNVSNDNVAVPFISSPASDPNFSVQDGCPLQLAPLQSCLVTITYSSPYVSSDSASIAIGPLSVALTGVTLQQPLAGGQSANSNISVSPTSLTFGAVGIGDHTAAQPVTVSNSGSSAVAITITTSPGFSQTNNCSGSVPANGSCILNVTYTPSQLGVVGGQLTVTPSGSSPVAIGLSGGGTNTVAFGSILVGQQATQWISQGSFVGSVSASVDGPFQVAVVNGYSYTAPPSIAFSSTSSGVCTQNCYVGVRAIPSNNGATNGTLTITQGSAAVTYPLSGSAEAATAAVLNQYNYQFGNVQQHQSSVPIQFTLTNTTSASISLGTASTSSNFTVSSLCGSSLAAGSSCSLWAAFAPSAAGSFAGTLSITAGGTNVSASLSGTATTDPTGVTFSPASVIVSAPATSYSSSITLTNTSAASVTVNSVSLGGAISSLSQSNNCSTLAASATCTVTLSASSISASKAGTGAVEFSITAASVEYNEQVPVVIAPAAGGAATASLTASPASLNFPPTAVGQASAAQFLKLTNNGSTTQTYALTAPAGFTMDTSGCTLAAGASCTVTVHFVPNSAGQSSATLSESGISFMLSGYGIPATKLAAPAYPSLLQPIVLTAVSGNNNEATMTIRNAGSAQLMFGTVSGSGAIVANTCTAGGVAPGGTCNLTVLTSVYQSACGDGCQGTQTATISVLSNADSSPDTYTLTQNYSSVSTLIAPGLRLNVPSYTFAQTNVGSAATATVILQSVGAGAATFAIGTTGDYSQTNNCNGTLTSPNQSCSVTVKFAPSTSGFRPGSLYVNSNAGVQSITLGGTGASSGPAATATSFSASPTTLAQGGNVSLTIRVTSSSGTPSGTVSLYAAGEYLGTFSLSNGQVSATVPTSPYPTGTYPVYAKYSGDSTHASSASATVTFTLTQPAVSTTATLTSSATYASPGQNVTLTAKVARSSGSGNATGTVSFLANGQSIAAATLNAGTATATIAASSYPQGTYSVQASYAGDSGDKPSTSNSLTITIGPPRATTTTTLSASPQTPNAGATTTLTATVTGTSPTGTISFYYGQQPLGTSTLHGGVATLAVSTSGIPPGTYEMTASYSGDTANSPSTSAAYPVTVRFLTTATTTLQPASVAPGQSTQITVKVARNGYSGNPSGGGTVYVNGAAAGSFTLTNGSASITYTVPSGAAAGTLPVFATYLGNSTDANSSSSTVNLTVQ